MSAQPDRNLTAREIAKLPREEQSRILREEAERIEKDAREREERECGENARDKRKASRKKEASPTKEMDERARRVFAQMAFAALPPDKQAEILRKCSGKKRVRRGKRQANPPIESCKALLKSLIFEQGKTGAKEVERICCKEHHFSRYAFFAARRALNLRAVRRVKPGAVSRNGLGKDGVWELVPEPE
jgi:hypothetical protein